MKYVCNDIFMLRTPSLPVNVFTDFMKFQRNDIEDFIEQNRLNNFFDKSILIATRSLYEAREKESLHRKKKMKAKELSLIKFLIRSSTRPTPYGFFAGVALGEFSGDIISDFIVDKKKAMIECRVDYSWLSHLVYELENNLTVCPQLRLRFNNNCYVSGDRLKNPHYSNHGFTMPKSVVVNRNHIRNTPLITYIKQEAQTFIVYNELKMRIQNKYPHVPEDKIMSTLNMLMDNEILLSNLRVPFNCVDGLEYVLKILEPMKGIDGLKEDLQKVNVLLNQINNECELEHIDAALIQSIYTKLDGLLVDANEKDLLSVTKGISLKQNKLPHEVKATVENFIEGLTYLQVDAPSQLENFKKQFQEEYGTNIEVPLCDIIDQNGFNGLSYLENNWPISDEKDKKIKQIVDEKILYCLQTQGEEVTLSKSDFLSLGSVNEDKLPKSFDISFIITKKDNHYHLTLAPVGGSESAGDMFNRFSHVLNENLFQQYKEAIKSQNILNKNEITVEIREGSSKGRLGNINNHNSEHAYYIALATNDDYTEAMELTLDDLLIGHQNGRIYIKSKSQGKQCKIVNDCMINKKILSEVTRLLLYISSDDETSLFARIFSFFHNQYFFVPRILFEGVVIQPKSWNLPALLFDLKTLSSFTESLQILRKKYSIDDTVYLSESDNRLMLNLNKEYSLEILYKNIQKYNTLLLNELEQNVLTDTICLDESGNGYVTEISCSLMLSIDKKRNVALDNQLLYILQNDNRPLMLLQDGWVYAKLYNMADRENEVLNYILLSLNDIGAPNFFFLRYSDDIGRHLRVRFKYKDKNTAQNHMSEIQKMLTSFREYKLINKVQFDIYFRENNRYGGSQLIELAEEVFFSDSRFVISLLKEFNMEEEAELEQAYLLGICTMLTAFNDSLEEMFDICDFTPLLDENKKTFRRKKHAYIETIERLLSCNFLGLSDQTISLIAEREKTIKQYYNKIVKTDLLTNSRESIISSIIHMFCNRLVGDQNLEQKYLNVIRESIANIIEKNKRIPKNKF